MLTPEDPYARWPGDGPTRAIVPTFTAVRLFVPAGIGARATGAWHGPAETGVRSADEDLLAPDPYPTRDDWCAARVEATEARLAALPTDVKLIVANHFPLRQDLAVLPRIPRFSIWCGTTKTNDWHRRFNIEAVVYGHLHLRSRDDRRRALRRGVARLSEAVEPAKTLADYLRIL